MIAFVKWHRPAPGIDVNVYEERLRLFHRRLARSRPPGFREVVSFKGTGQPWPDTPDPSYADWYLLENSAALDGLRAMAVSGNREEIHSALAARAAPDLATGLYRSLSGRLDPRDARRIHWMAKPAALSYEDWQRMLESTTGPDPIGLWIRYLGLSPAPEFALLVNASSSFDQARWQPSRRCSGSLLEVISIAQN